MIIVVNKHRVRSNVKTGNREPVFRCSHSKTGKPWYQESVYVENGKLIYDPEHPLPCGATVWMEAV
jgi:hypothetical protein